MLIIKSSDLADASSILDFVRKTPRKPICFFATLAVSKMLSLALD